MTITHIYDRMEELLEIIHKHNHNQDYVRICEMELGALEQEREILEVVFKSNFYCFCPGHMDESHISNSA